jgi:hypothetical protein
MVLVRRQWIEHERLTFPLAQVPISMIGESGAEDSSNLLSDFFGVAGLGGAAQWFLTLASKRWLWFPIHPIAFPISAMWTTHHLMPSIFIAWLVKSVVLRYGGVTLYRSTRPFFLGLILGHYAAGGLWCVIDAFTGMTGNHLFFW